MCLLRKILMRLRGMNFCTSSAHFALSLVRQLKGPKCIQIVQHTPKHEFRSHQGQSGAFVAKNSDTTSRHELLHHFGPFCTEFCRQPNSPKCSQIVQITPKYEFRIQWGGSSVFIVKNSDVISWHELLHHFGPFCTECCNATKLSQMHPSSTKRTET